MKNLLCLVVSSSLVLACSSAVLDLPSDDASVAVDSVGVKTDVASVDNGPTGTDITSGAGEVAVEVAQKPCVDKDNDGYCDNAPQPGDCNDNDPAVHPGAVELCDGIDNNCNGVVDEGCPTSTSATVTVTFPNSLTRVLNVQVWTSKSQLGGWWDKSVSASTTSLTADLGTVDVAACGLRLNVSKGNPANSWLCEGNGSTANLDPDASITIKWGSKTFTKSDLKIWSASGGTNSGCSALLQVVTTGACAL